MFDFTKFWQSLQYNAADPLLFNSAFFLLLFLLLLVLYRCVHRRTMLRTGLVIFFSLYFFYKACGWYVGFIVLAAIADFHLSNAIAISNTHKKRKLLLVLSIVVNLGLLCFFKYTNLFIETVNALQIGRLEPLQLVLPIGISFYTFENLSYTIDVYRKTIQPVQSFWDYLFFLSFFPKLMMGPIVRAKDFIPQIRQPVVVSQAQVGAGLYLLSAGIFKKMVISDYLYVNYVERIFDEPARYSGIECLTGVYGYAMVIYCDFSGYSDMALGMGKWMGLEINPNFDSPYQSKSITEFWRRWHMSLSAWLRDYLYIPLGGNRGGRLKQYSNLMATMLLGGLWHGASWNFVVWGGLHGAALSADKMKLSLINRFAGWRAHVTRYSRWYTLTGVVLTFHFVCFCWIFFKAKSFTDSWSMLHQITGNFNGSAALQLASAYTGVLLLIATAMVLHFVPRRSENRVIAWITGSNIWVKALILLLVILLAIQVKQAEPVLPVYLQF
jgi:D-alanyl-lipoteichoic acid acyltransferase DltB (MBOAT superfamily)